MRAWREIPQCILQCKLDKKKLRSSCEIMNIFINTSNLSRCYATRCLPGGVFDGITKTTRNYLPFPRLKSNLVFLQVHVVLHCLSAASVEGDREAIHCKYLLMKTSFTVTTFYCVCWSGRKIVGIASLSTDAPSKASFSIFFQILFFYKNQ